MEADGDIALAAVQEIKGALPYSHSLISVAVDHAWVTLEGQAEWNYQKERADSAVRRVKSVRGVTDAILVKAQLDPGDIRRRIDEAFQHRRRHEIG
jgi:VCBS repeat-containing protein